jgi:phage terminase large subunit GpA-like protein
VRAVNAVVMNGWADGLEPEPVLTVSEWSDAHRMLSGKASAEPGRWSTDRTPYLREIMDTLSAMNPCHRTVFMKGAQIGGTECGNNWIGYVIHHAPAPILVVQPTVEVAKRVSKQRIAPMIESTPALRERVKEARARDSGNTTFVKEFDGGLLIMTGANSGAGLRSMPIRYLFMDEVDEYPGDVDGQGDPVALAEKRTTTFSRRKVFLVSTPTIKGLSRIEREFLASDQRRYFVPCPHCGHMDWIRWENIRWSERQPETAALACTACGALIEERCKIEMLARGEWRATAPGTGLTAGFHLSSLYSPLGWKSWSGCVAEFLEVKEDPFRLKTWVNTVLGETWEERGDSVEPDAVLSRAERYAAEVPTGVGILVASVDVQGDRLECKVKGYGAGEESWLIAVSQFHGDPGTNTVWFELDRFLQQTFTHESGQKLKIECVTIDSGGHHTEQVYRFCKVRLARRVFAVRGGNERGKEIVSKPTMHNRYRTKLFTLCVDSAKDMIYSRLRIGAPGPGYMHLPEWTDAEYVAQLTAEKAIRKYVKGRGSVRQWIKTRERNEALDLEVYCLAALYILGPVVIRTLPERATRLATAANAAQDGSKPAGAPGLATRPNLRVRPRGGWVNRW